jgi:hypothetical protein
VADFEQIEPFNEVLGNSATGKYSFDEDNK